MCTAQGTVGVAGASRPAATKEDNGGPTGEGNKQQVKSMDFILRAMRSHRRVLSKTVAASWKRIEGEQETRRRFVAKAQEVDQAAGMKAKP